jgi:NADPH:quinone reductase-like Zn-dependent oxidoreductase
MLSTFQSIRHDKYPFIDPCNDYLKDSAKGKTVLVTGASRGIGKVSITCAVLLPNLQHNDY